MSQELEIAKVILAEAGAFSALLVAVISVILSQWRWIRGQDIEKKFKFITWYMVLVEILSTTTVLFSFLIVNQGENWQHFALFFTASRGLFVATVVAVPLGLVLSVVMILSI